MNELILYTSEDGKSRIQLRADGQTVWLTQAEMAELFATSKQNVSLHLRNVFEVNELRDDSVVKQSLMTATDGKRYSTRLYNLDAILAVGYRVRSPRGVQFRRPRMRSTPSIGWSGRQAIPMRFWMDNVGQIIASNGFPLLMSAGSVSHQQMEAATSGRYLAFDEQCKQQEARAADVAELAAIENKIKRRLKP